MTPTAISKPPIIVAIINKAAALNKAGYGKNNPVEVVMRSNVITDILSVKLALPIPIYRLL